MARRYYRSHRRKKRSDFEELLTAGVSIVALGTAAIILSLRQSDGTGVPGGLIAIVVIVAALVILAVSIRLYLTARHQRLMLFLSEDEVDAMPGLVFESYVATLLQTQGYRTSITRASGDYGVDVIAVKDGLRTAVQVKRYHRPVDQKAVREAIAGMAFYRCSESMVITNSTFTPAAQVLAKSNDCTLVDREQLARWVAEAQKNMPAKRPAHL